MTTAVIDGMVRYLQYLLVDGKFYTIFSLLFVSGGFITSASVH
jgi:uncharacterized protein